MQHVLPGPSLDRTAREVREAHARGAADEALHAVIQFVDDLAAASPAVRRAAIRAEPETTGSTRWDALLAGVVEYMVHRHGLPTPGWTAAPSRFLHRFWFVIEDILGRPAPGLAASAFVASPRELAIRGVFLDRSSLESV